MEKQPNNLRQMKCIFGAFGGCWMLSCRAGLQLSKKKKVSKYSFIFLNEFTAATLISSWDLLSAHF